MKKGRDKVAAFLFLGVIPKPAKGGGGTLRYPYTSIVVYKTSEED